MAHRAPSAPPVLPGYDYRYPLGTGGFADVFLYEQDMPRRSVAVKVLLAGLVDPEVRRRFNAEADVMAKLAAHPSILTVYAASISADGRPYLVMEHCPGAIVRRDENGRSAPLAFDRVLEVGVRMASALETAHRAGVLHRDIKPSNILVTSFGSPVLADFGIATSLAANHQEQLFAMSVPWSAPEVLKEETTGTVQSEVWSLGATLYTLLAGHGPFEKPSKEENSRVKQRSRILRERPQPIDAPAEVREVLLRSMSKDPAERQQSMLELARELQTAQAMLRLPQTPLELPIEEWAPTVDSAGFTDAGIRGAVVSTVAVESRRTRSRTAPARQDTGSATAIAHSGERDPLLSRTAARWIIGVSCAVIVAGAVAIALHVAGLL